MGILNGGLKAERHNYATTADETYKAMLDLLRNSKTFTLKARNDKKQACIFTTGVTAFAWGEDLVATVDAADTGSSVSALVRSKTKHAPLTQIHKNKKDIELFFSELDQKLGSASAQ
ncbi:hypothetical protein OZX67_01655 [Bifidobacterium sp. ESL0728]|uniref:hypothetical protein n=1 Tax=Bifidobacterium sp. ESL0728 TaxID=2983220 RepID=UPI0023F8924E|nr:hypothetical protein [Bifidobacterium sp. ESL0728]WEV59301.1 hypothetical protein OZX67_01655 [Bifidobacterium sp. ESL0728]